MIEPIWVWGVPFAPMTLEETVEAVDDLIESQRPSYFITANLHYLMLSNENPDLGEINARAAFILADGAPVVWASRKTPTPLPERVAGSDLIFHLCDLSARKDRRLFFLALRKGWPRRRRRNSGALSRHSGGRHGMPAVPQTDRRGTRSVARSHPRRESRHPLRGVRPAEGGTLDLRESRAAGRPRERTGRRLARIRRGAVRPGPALDAAYGPGMGLPSPPRTPPALLAIRPQRLVHGTDDRPGPDPKARFAPDRSVGFARSRRTASATRLIRPPS